MRDNNKNIALLVMDFQKIILDKFHQQENDRYVISNTASLIATARSAEVLVIYVSVGFRNGYPEVSQNNKIFSSIKDDGCFLIDSEDASIHAEVSPIDDEVIIIKRRVSAFSFTELDMVLRAQGIETLILAGVSTGGVVLSTALQAFDLDYRLIIVGDCCADPDHETNLFLLKKILPRYADISCLTEISEYLV